MINEVFKDNINYSRVQKKISPILLSAKNKVQKPISPRFVAFFLLISDLLSILLSFKFIYWLDIGQRLSLYSIVLNMLPVICWVLLIYYIFDLYKPNDHISGLRAPGRTILANIVAFFFLIIGSMLTSKMFFAHAFSEYFLLICFLPTTAATTLARFFVALYIRKTDQNIRWLFIGDNISTAKFIQDYENQQMRGELFFVSSEKEKKQPANENIHPIAIEMLDKKMGELWSGVILGVGAVLPPNFMKELLAMRVKGVLIYNLDDFYENYWFRVPLHILEERWFVVTQGFQLLHNPVGWRLKRILDIVISFLMTAFSLPIMVIIGLIIKLDSPGAAIFKQTRVGLHGSLFTLYKFRSMYFGSEEKGDKYTQKNDQRITRIGKFLRLTRLDELPQLINVLRGEMSLIGPRAEWIKCTEGYYKEIDFYQYRHLVRPGITGWAQVLYSYGSSLEDTQNKLEYDLFYIKNYSLFLDIAILFKTIRVMLFGRGR